MTAEQPSPRGFNTLNEKPLHAALKQWLAAPEDAFEVKLEGYFIDLIHEEVLIEVQTGSFGAIRKKLTVLCENHPVRLVYPVAVEKWVVLQPLEADGSPVRRKSPRRDSLYSLFRELIYLPKLMQHPNFSLQVLLIQEEEMRQSNGKTRRRHEKGWVKVERRLIQVVGQRTFTTPADLSTLLPEEVGNLFTTQELAKATRQPDWLARRMIYCLKEMGELQPAGKRGRSNLFARPQVWKDPFHP